MQVVVVRHGCAGDKRSWTGDDDERPLDEAGERQSLALADLLAEADPGIRRLRTSPTRRCRDTLVPLARRLGLPVEDDAGLATGHGDDALARAVAAPDADACLLCTHGELMEPLLADLRADGVPIAAKDHDDAWLLGKGTAWVLDVDTDGRVTSLRHVAPVPSLACDAHRGPGTS